MAGGVAPCQEVRDACRCGERPSGHPGLGRAVDEVHQRRTASGGGNREGDEGRDLFAISEIPGTSR